MYSFLKIQFCTDKRKSGVKFIVGDKCHSGEKGKFYLISQNKSLTNCFPLTGFTTKGLLVLYGWFFSVHIKQVDSLKKKTHKKTFIPTRKPDQERVSITSNLYK